MHILKIKPTKTHDGTTNEVVKRPTTFFGIIQLNEQ